MTFLDKKLIQQMVTDLNTVVDKHVTQKILIKIRMDLSKSPKGMKLLRECDGLRPLVSFVKRPSKRILDLALSILANCCTDQDCVQEVMKLNVVPALLVILKTIPNQLILCRTCRLLGNLASEKKNAKTIQDGKIVNSLVALLDDEGIDPGTLLMITRLIGKMWRLETFQVDVFLYGIIKRVTMALIKLSQPKNNGESDANGVGGEAQETPPSAFNPKQFQRESNQVHKSMENNQEQRSIQEESFQRAAQLNGQGSSKSPAEDFVFPENAGGREVIGCMLKCILMAASSKSYQFSEQIIKNPGSLKCFLFYCGAESPFRSTALHIVSSLAYNPAVRYEIGSANGVDIILSLLKEESLTLTESEYKYCVNIICLLAASSCNRAKIRYCGGMRLLLKRFRDTKNASERDMILYGLSIFANDQMSVQFLVREGLITTLLARMTIELDAMPEYHVAVPIAAKDSENSEKNPQKLKRKSSRNENSSGNKLKRPNYGRLSPNTGCYSDSMESPTSSSGYGSVSNRSPSYSSYSSPKSTDFDSDADSATVLRKEIEEIVTGS